MKDWLEGLELLNRTRPQFAPDATRARAFRQIGRFLETQTRRGARYDLASPSCPLWPTILDRLMRAVGEIQAAELRPDEVRLWQMYNHGAVIESDEIAMGFDVIAMPRRFGWPEPTELLAAIAQTIDVLFITHHHPDHFDRALVAECLHLGRPVIMPEPLAHGVAGQAGELGYDPNLYPMEHGQKLELYDLKIKARRGIHVWRDSANEIPLIVYEVTCQEGFRFVFGGDLDYTARFGQENLPSRDRVCRPRPDLFFVPWRSPNERYEPQSPTDVTPLVEALRIVIGEMAPRALIFEHYAELEHVYDGLPASYELALALQEQLNIPSALLFWGESILLSPRETCT